MSTFKAKGLKTNGFWIAMMVGSLALEIQHILELQFLEDSVSVRGSFGGLSVFASDPEQAIAQGDAQDWLH